MIIAADEDVLIDKLIDDVKQMVDKGLESIGILCKTADRSKEVYNAIRGRLNASLLTQDDMNFSKGVIVLPVYLAKGLEFDGAMVLDADRETYGRDKDRKLFYTACTRALHKLYLYCCGEASIFINDIPEHYYETVNI